AAAERKRVRPGMPESYERLFHESGEPVGVRNFMLLLNGKTPAAQRLEESRLQRAIGVIYKPETERASHYFKAQLSKQFDAMIHLDITTALEPLELTSQWETGEPPETYPTGL